MRSLQRIKWGCRFAAAAFLILLMLTAAAQPALAAGTGTVKGDHVNVRSGAGVAHDMVTSLNKGDAVVVDGSQKDGDGKKWYQVSFSKDGTAYQGYIRADYVSYKKAQQPQQETIAVIDASDAVQPDSQAPEQTDGQASAAEKQDKTLKNKKAVVTATHVNVRKKTVTGAVVAQVTKGDIVAAAKKKKGSDGKVWYYISFSVGGKVKKGWIRSDFIRIEQEAEPQQPEAAPADTAAAPAIKRTGKVKASNVNVRKKRVTGAVVARLSVGDSIGVIKSKKGADNLKWYYITFTQDTKTKKGWIRSDFVKLDKKVKKDPEQIDASDAQSSNDDAVPELSDEEFEAYIAQQGFPESYKTGLRALHAKYPKWTFRAVQTGLNWPDVIAAESKTGLNLVSKTASASWKSTESTAYDWKKNVWYTFDGGKWAAASEDLIKYYMDPRNFMDDTNIFQFESLEFENYQNAAGVQELLKASFMNGDYTEPDGTVRSYAQTFVEVGGLVGVSPYHLAARCYQEQGKGTSDSISGKVSGYENIFNYYNIGAYAVGKNSPTKQGLIYASSTGASEALNYDRPWNTRYKSLLGGARYVAAKYVKLGQNTLYFQKFNVVNQKNGIYKHQYMTNVQAAASEAVKMSKAYVDKNSELVFYIPVYAQMPDASCVIPTGNLNPNNYLSELTVSEQGLTPVFDGATDSYDLTVEADVTQVTLQAKAVAETSVVSGTGTVPLQQGTNEVQIQCTSESGAVRIYTLHIMRK